MTPSVLMKFDQGDPSAGESPIVRCQECGWEVGACSHTRSAGTRYERKLAVDREAYRTLMGLPASHPPCAWCGGVIDPRKRIGTKYCRPLCNWAVRDYRRRQRDRANALRGGKAK